MTDPTYDEREARLRRFYAAVHTDRLLSSAHAAMKVADDEQAALFDSDDPTVHARMLDTLTRHGVLTQQTAAWHGGTEAWLATERRDIGSDEALAILRERLTGEAS